MTEKIKFQTVYDTWIYGEDVENPDMLKDPTGFYDWLFESKNEADLQKYDEDGNELDGPDDLDIFSDLI